jgi:hypothetical protein
MADGRDYKRAANAACFRTTLPLLSSAKQVTLCVAAINLSDKDDLKKLNAPFSVVVFDKNDFRALGGAAFRDTCFFHIGKDEFELISFECLFH